jgi:hypothetical protein
MQAQGLLWPCQLECQRQERLVTPWRTPLPSVRGPHTVASNPSIERTAQRPLRALWSAAHVERWAP